MQRKLVLHCWRSVFGPWKPTNILSSKLFSFCLCVIVFFPYVCICLFNAKKCYSFVLCLKGWTTEFRTSKNQSLNICVLLCLFLSICLCCFKSCCGNRETRRKTTLTLGKRTEENYKIDAKQLAEHRVIQVKFLCRSSQEYPSMYCSHIYVPPWAWAENLEKQAVRTEDHPSPISPLL